MKKVITPRTSQKDAYRPKPILPAFLRMLIPVPIRNWGRRLVALMNDRKYRRLSTPEVFNTIYAGRVWGQPEADSDYYSGSGSHDLDLVGPYIEASRRFLNEQYPCGAHLVDLGCGDFHVGQAFVDLATTYTACDIVSEVVASNRRKYGTQVDFEQIDVTAGPLPNGDVAMLRQVLQHLSNTDIAKVLPLLSGYRHVIVTEVVPTTPYKPNRDKLTGPETRIWIPSAVDLSEPPFRFHARTSEVLCRVPDGESTVVTTVFDLSRREVQSETLR